MTFQQLVDHAIHDGGDTLAAFMRGTNGWNTADVRFMGLPLTIDEDDISVDSNLGFDFESTQK